MSHFIVLVIGENPEQQLQGYHEFESTGIDDRYVKNVDITKAVLSYAEDCGLTFGLEEYGLKNKVIKSKLDLDIMFKHKYGYALVQDGKLIEAIQRTNPNAKWDWYRPECGFLLKDKTKNFVALKKDIDFETKITNARLEAQKEYDKFQILLSSNNLKFPKTREECLAEFQTYIEANEFYSKQAAVKVFNKHKFEFKGPYYECPFSYFGKSKEDFIERERYQGVVTFAVVKDSQWFSRRENLWVSTSNDISREDWNAKFWELVNSVPDDTMFSLYNCHI